MNISLKGIKELLFVGGATMAIALSFSSCRKEASSLGLQPTDSLTSYLEKLRTYKKSDHQIMAAYFRTWRDRATDPIVNKTSMKELPDSLDIAFVFPDYTPEDNTFWDSLKTSYVPHLRARGTKVVMTTDIGAALDKNFPNTPAGYAALADKIIAEKMTRYDLDGVDFDVERNLSAEDLQRAIGVFNALSKRLGPKSGTDKLLIYDTNQDGTTSLFTAVHGLINYVLVQSYGRSMGSLQPTYNTYANLIRPDQYLIGFTFYEERSAGWGDVGIPLEDSRAFNYVMWNPSQGKKGGIFSYAVDRDGVPQGESDIVATTYSVTRRLISAVNPQ
ncbi:MAG: chitinase [Sphingobacterium sp.]|jgi:hypothetical protein|nr:chitinase [Sphingobacterium sp.]